MKTVYMPNGRLVRLEAQDGPPTEPGWYLAEYTPRHGEPHSIAREVRIDGAGTLDHGPDSARLEWWARIVFEAPGGALTGGGAADGEAGVALGVGADLAEPSALGREVADPRPTLSEVRWRVGARDDEPTAEAVGRLIAGLTAQLEDAKEALVSADIIRIFGTTPLAAWADERDALRARVADITERVLAAIGRDHLLLAGPMSCDKLVTEVAEGEMALRGMRDDMWAARRERDLAGDRANIAEARVAELEAALRWIPVTERLPGRHAVVLTHCIHDEVFWIATYSPTPPGKGRLDSEWWGEGGRPLLVTHWRPLPAGPEVQP